MLHHPWVNATGRASILPLPSPPPGLSALTGRPCTAAQTPAKSAPLGSRALCTVYGHLACPPSTCAGLGAPADRLHGGAAQMFCSIALASSVSRARRLKPRWLLDSLACAASQQHACENCAAGMRTVHACSHGAGELCRRHAGEVACFHAGQEFRAGMCASGDVPA
jgi:hypothetical protein